MRYLMAKLLILTMTFGIGQLVLASDTPEHERSASMTAAQLEQAGDEARATKDFEHAVDYFNAAIRRENRNPVLYNKLGLSYLRLGNLRAAKYDFQKAIKLNSKFADGINNLGAVEYMKKDYGAAAKQFKKAVALDETRSTFHVNLGAAWFAQKKLDRAIAEYARALELNPNALAAGNAGVAAQIASPEERARYAYMLAKIYALRGENDECLRHLRRAKEEGYRDLASIYKDAQFAKVWNDPRLAEIAPAPEK
jgi:tetratricopeptide (TPR) repeat protein